MTTANIALRMPLPAGKDLLSTHSLPLRTGHCKVLKRPFLDKIRTSMQEGGQEKAQPKVAKKAWLLHSTLCLCHQAPLSERAHKCKDWEREDNGWPSRSLFISDTTAVY